MHKKTPENIFIAAARVRTGMLQKQFAPLIGTTKDTLSQYETGARQPSKRVLDKVRRLLIERGFAKEPCSLIEEKLLEEFRQLVSTDQEWISGIVTRLAQTPKRRAKPR